MTTDSRRRASARPVRLSPTPPPHVSASADVGASSRDVFRLIADYQSGHPRILPPQFFRNLRVGRGGFGAGTVIYYDMFAFGRTQRMSAWVSEPDPGRVLVETNSQTGAVTTFTVDPLGIGGSRVTIATRLRVGSGMRGRLDLWLMKRFLRKVHVAELALIDRESRGGEWPGTHVVAKTAEVRD